MRWVPVSQPKIPTPISTSSQYDFLVTEPDLKKHNHEQPDT
jgi:hypothetical protein